MDNFSSTMLGTLVGGVLGTIICSVGVFFIQKLSGTPKHSSLGVTLNQFVNNQRIQNITNIEAQVTYHQTVTIKTQPDKQHSNDDDSWVWILLIVFLGLSTGATAFWEKNKYTIFIILMIAIGIGLGICIYFAYILTKANLKRCFDDFLWVFGSFIILSINASTLCSATFFPLYSTSIKKVPLILGTVNLTQMIGLAILFLLVLVITIVLICFSSAQWCVLHNKKVPGFIVNIWKNNRLWFFSIGIGSIFTIFYGTGLLWRWLLPS
jgi:hypothetical protein